MIVAHGLRTSLETMNLKHVRKTLDHRSNEKVAHIERQLFAIGIPSDFLEVLEDIFPIPKVPLGHALFLEELFGNGNGTLFKTLLFGVFAGAMPACSNPATEVELLLYGPSEISARLLIRLAYCRVFRPVNPA